MKKIKINMIVTVNYIVNLKKKKKLHFLFDIFALKKKYISYLFFLKAKILQQF